MAGSFSDYLENKILDHVFVGTAYTAPTTIWFALFTVAPTDAGGGTEVSGGSYARVSKTPSGIFGASSGGSITTTDSVAFTTATGNWGTIVAFAIFDASTSGNMLAWGDLTLSKTVGTGDTASFSAGSLIINLT